MHIVADVTYQISGSKFSVHLPRLPVECNTTTNLHMQSHHHPNYFNEKRKIDTQGQEFEHQENSHQVWLK